MKPFTLAALTSGAAAQWWSGSPDCVSSCISSYWATVTPNDVWPTPTAFCDAGRSSSLSTCIDDSCKATPTAVSSYSSLASSLCARYASCDDSTFTAPAGGWGGGGGGWGPWGSFTNSQGQVTATGCMWDGSPWMGGGAGGAWSGWAGGPWGSGWTVHTVTQTATLTVSESGGLVTTTGLVAVAEAVSGTVTSTSTLTGTGATATATSTSGSGSGNTISAAAGRGVEGFDKGTLALGAMLAGFVAVLGWL